MTIIPIRGVKDAPKDERSRMETVVLTPEAMNTWVLPPFQAPLRENAKVKQIADELAAQSGTAAISGVITLGILPNDKTIYLLDGQHRRHAAFLSGRAEFYADIRVCMFDTMGEMAEEYQRLNTPIAKKTPDDQLRALAENSKVLRLITDQCPFVGYRFIRANPESVIVGMAAVLRRWRGSAYDTPGISTGKNAIDIALEFTVEDAEQLTRFLAIAFTAWGKDLANQRLWSGLNMTMCMWMWRVLVLDRERTGTRRYALLTSDQFKRCLMTVSSDTDYVDWLAGRNMNERDRASCYTRLRNAFLRRLHSEGEDKMKMPRPNWATN